MLELDHKESWALKNWWFWSVVLEKTLESPLDCQEVKPVNLKVLYIHWKDWCVSWNSNTLATWCKELAYWESPWCWERLKAGGEGTTEDEMVGWHHQLDGHAFKQALGWWWTGRPGVLQSMGSKRVQHDWATELKWTDTTILTIQC